MVSGVQKMAEMKLSSRSLKKFKKVLRAGSNVGRKAYCFNIQGEKTVQNKKFEIHAKNDF